jgi:ribonuclease HI
LATHWTRNKTLYFCVVTQKRVVGFKKIVFKCPLNCPICDQNIEDDWHLLFACTESIQARQTSGLEHVISPRLQQAQTAAEVVFSICQSEDKDTTGLFAVLVWNLWNNRNNTVWNETRETGRSVGFRTRHLWEEWNMANTLNHSAATRHFDKQQQQSWQKPPREWYKCNVDAGFHIEANKSSMGWCLRDHLGRFVLAGTHWKDGSCSVVEGEALALLQAMKEMELRGITQVIFETDSKNVVDAIHALNNGNSKFSSIIHNINNALLLNSNFVVKFVKRQANTVVHSLARAAVLWSNHHVIESIPLCIYVYQKKNY